MRRRVMMTQSYPKGVYIQRTDGLLYSNSDWNTEWNSEAIGVAVVDDEVSFVIAPDIIEGKKLAPSSNTVYSWGVPIADTLANALKYKDGPLYTQKLYEATHGGYACAAPAVLEYTFKDGKTGYIGSVYEWNIVLQNRDEIQTCLSKIGATPFRFKNSSFLHYWASIIGDIRTDSDPYTFQGWTFRYANGSYSITLDMPSYSTTNMAVRPFKRL